MSAVAFDTLKLARKLRDTAQMTQAQAEGVADALAEAMSGAELATKTDLAHAVAQVETSLGARISEAKADTLKAIMAMTVSAIVINSAIVLGAMFGLAKLLGH